VEHIKIKCLPLHLMFYQSFKGHLKKNLSDNIRIQRIYAANRRLDLAAYIFFVLVKVVTHGQN
jgi:hypothetical protein